MIQKRFLIFWGIIACLSGCRSNKRPSLPRQEIPQLPSFFDVRPSKSPVSYLYAPGFQNTEVAMGRFCPEFTAMTGEKITWRSGIHTIGQPHSAVVFSEIDLRKPTYFTLNPLTAFINGLRRDFAPLAQRLMQDTLNFTVEDNPESPLSVVNYSFNLSKANLGQKRDIRLLHKAYLEHEKKYAQSDIVLYGDSRGAATIFNFIALHRPARVKAAVLEGIFDDLPHVVKHFLYTDKKECEEQRIYSIAQFTLRSYQEKGASPRKSAKIIADDIPLLLIASLKDGLVPAQSAFYLYNCLRDRGHAKVHLLVLEHSLHPMYALQDDKRIYEATVHAFYKHYNLPHNSAAALVGQEYFNKTQPTKTLLEQTYRLPRCALCGE